ncbi:hypothetical protein BBJ28_00004791 [Nothophytophthora sp. Chile5]|nr:hypothetical protein BBJ28_00004791 [Nothophytophthora sp. Chile5]
MAAQSCLRQYFQALGVLIPTTAVGIISIFVAAGSNYILIYGVGSWQGLGFVGSPIATVIASWFQPIALFSYGFLLKRHHHRAWNGWDRHAFTLARLRSFVKVAGPIASNSFVSNLANALVALVAASLGARIIAANAVISGLWGLLWALFWGYGCATQVRVANYLGAGKPHLARRVTALGFACTGVVVALLAVATSLLDQRIIAIYTADPELLAICKRVLPVFIAAYVFESGEVLCAGVLTGMSQVKTVFWTSAMATWLINLPVAYIGGAFPAFTTLTKPLFLELMMALLHPLAGLTLGFGFPALWVGVLSMEIFKVSSYVLALSRVHWDDAAARVMLEMEATPTTEQGAVGFITAVVDSQPTGCLATMSEATTPPLTTSPFDRRRRMRNENCNFNSLATGVVKPFSPNNSQSQKWREV